MTAILISVVICISSSVCEVRMGGSRAWRNNNPGNLRSAPTEYGQAGGEAVFLNRQLGHEALISLLKRKYWNSTLEETIERYAPSFENNTTKYLNFLSKYAHIPKNQKLSGCTARQFAKLVSGIEKYEGWIEGRIILGKLQDKEVTYKEPEENKPKEKK